MGQVLIMEAPPSDRISREKVIKYKVRNYLNKIYDLRWRQKYELENIEREWTDFESCESAIKRTIELQEEILAILVDTQGDRRCYRTWMREKENPTHAAAFAELPFH